jgi:hypothetical protein
MGKIISDFCYYNWLNNKDHVLWKWKGTFEACPNICPWKVMLSNYTWIRPTRFISQNWILDVEQSIIAVCIRRAYFSQAEHHIPPLLTKIFFLPTLQHMNTYVHIYSPLTHVIFIYPFLCTFYLSLLSIFLFLITYFLFPK